MTSFATPAGRRIARTMPADQSPDGRQLYFAGIFAGGLP
jgi:hypothetical protein